MSLWDCFADRERAGKRVTPAIAGAGFVGRGLVHHLARTPGIAPPLLANRNPERALKLLLEAGYDQAGIVVSEDIDALQGAVAEGRPAVTRDARVVAEVRGVSLLIEATGAMDYGTEVIRSSLHAGVDVISYNAEVDALLGHLLSHEAEQHGALYTIADGDQPGVLLRVLAEVRSFGLRGVAAMNCKRNLDVHQDPERSREYAARDNTSVAMTTAFGDGTKMHIENVVVANLSGLSPLPIGTPGVHTTVADVADDVASKGFPEGFVHFTLGGDFGGGVLVLADSEDPAFDGPYLRYGKLGDGPLYPFFRPYHLIHLEVPSTIASVVLERTTLGRRTKRPVAECVAIAKQDLSPGTALDGIGGATCYGTAAAGADDLLPIGLSTHARLLRSVPIDTPITLDDVEIDENAPLVQVRLLQDRLTA